MKDFKDEVVVTSSPMFLDLTARGDEAGKVVPGRSYA
jgi:hypothetical protein